ncbi:MAG: DUF2254 domain-containing protein [Streptosporangiaceae bacterium]
MRNSLWIVPFVCVAVAIAIGLTFPMIDEHTTATVGITFGADAARSVLGAIAGGMITFTGFVFSILLLAVQFGSSQFSPRMLRRFLRDPSTKAALGTFMATFIYALAVLRVVGTGTDRTFVPNNSVSVAVLLLLLSMLMFLRLLTRTTQGLRVAAVLRDLGRDARRVVDRVYPEPVIAGEGGEFQGPDPDRPVRTVTYHGGPGVVQSADVASLIERGRKAGAVIELVPRFGDLITEGSTLFRVHLGAGEIDDEWLRSTVATGDERTMDQDPAFAFRLLADISVKALSPGVNDPTTSVQALDQIELLLRQIAGRRLVPGIGRDASGTVRFRYQAPPWKDYLSLAIDETRQYGESSVQVMRRLRALLEDLRASVPEFRRPAIDAELALLDSATGRMFSDYDDQLAAAASDRQGLGATEARGHLPPRPTAAAGSGS